MNAAAVRSFVRGEVADVDTELPEDAIPLWQSRVRLILVTAAGCQPCELQKRSMPDDVRYETFDIEKVNEAGYKIRTTPTLMVFVDGKLEDTSSGLLRGDRLRAFLDRWGFTDNDTQPDDADRTDDDFNPWSNPRRWNRGPIRDRIDERKRPHSHGGSSANGSDSLAVERRVHVSCGCIFTYSSVTQAIRKGAESPSRTGCETPIEEEQVRRSKANTYVAQKRQISADFRVEMDWGNSVKLLRISNIVPSEPNTLRNFHCQISKVATDIKMAIAVRLRNSVRVSNAVA